MMHIARRRPAALDIALKALVGRRDQCHRHVVASCISPWPRSGESSVGMATNSTEALVVYALHSGPS